jgi:cell division septation protein DedD
LAIGLLAAALLACPATAQTDSDADFPPAFPSFPRSTSFGDIRLWVAGDTNLDQNKIALTTADAVFAFSDDKPAASSGVVTRQVREEVISADLAISLDGRSATADIEFDCGHAETTVDQVMVYPGNNLSGGQPKRLAAGRWLAANTSLDLTDLAQVACAAKPPAASPARHGRAARTAQAAALRGQAAPSPTESQAAATAATAAALGQAAWVQIGAYATVAIANDKWNALKARRGDLPPGLGLRTEPAPHGAKVLQRALIGPFDTRAQARDFCASLKANGGDCIVR